MSLTPLKNGSSVESAADKLTIETPEQTALEFAVAGIGSRFLAILIDVLIQSGVAIATLFGFIVISSGLSLGNSKAGLWVTALILLFYFLLYFGYYAFFEIIWNGQTPGKRKAGLRVIKDSGRPLTPAESIGRNLLRIVDWLPGFYAVGIVSALLTKENKRLGDLVAGSLVVRESSLSDLKPVSVWQTAQAPTVQVASPLGAANLTPEESALIDSFLTRRSELDFDVRVRMAEQIFQRLKPKLTLAADNTLSVEKILESL